MQTKIILTLSVILPMVVLPGCNMSSADIPVLFDDTDHETDDDELTWDDEDVVSTLDINELPFPHRTDPFTPLTGPVKTEVSTVQLNGFVDVEEPKAMLRIGERIFVVTEGQQLPGVRIVKIAPPILTIEQSGTERDLTLAN